MIITYKFTIMVITYKFTIMINTYYKFTMAICHITVKGQRQQKPKAKKHKTKPVGMVGGGGGGGGASAVCLRGWPSTCIWSCTARLTAQ